jgi:hypothetical protein
MPSPGPKKCFKGKVSSINNFYADATKPYTQGQGVTGMPSLDGMPSFDGNLKQNM